MRRRPASAFLSIAFMAAVAACGPATPTSAPVAATYGEYATEACSAWETLFRVVGNPETATWTPEVRALQAAAEARDAATAARLQGAINSELEVARRHIAVAAGWAPAARSMAQTDRLFLAMEAWITAYVNVARGVPSAPEPQQAFEAAGGLDSWRSLLEASTDMQGYRPASAPQCPNAPLTP